jgi:hypothetical protein
MANPEYCFWREQNSTRLDAMAFLLGINHNALVALLAELIEAPVEQGSSGLVWC